MATIRSVVDTYTASTAPKKNYGSVVKLVVSSTAKYGWIFWANPVPPKAKVLSAILHIRNAAAQTGSVAMTVRPATAAWAANRVTWSTNPTVNAAAGVSLTKTGAAANTDWAMDVTSILQSVSDGAATWFGLQISTDSTTSLPFWSAQAPTSGNRPWIDITWSVDPPSPTNLSPRIGGVVGTSKPVLSADFGSTITSVQVQISTVSNFGSIFWDSNERAAGTAALDLSDPTLAFGGLAASTTYYWRIRVKDSAGTWSPYSAASSLSYAANGSVTLTNPTVAVPYVEEPTPAISWTFSNQTAYQVLLRDASDLSNLLWDSGKVTSTASSASVPTGIIETTTSSYTVTVRCWDNVDRVANSGLPVWSETSLTFQYRYSASVTPVSSLVVDANNETGLANITFFRATAPDSFTLVRDGCVIRSDIDPVTIRDAVDPTKYTLIDLPPGRRNSITYSVPCVVNGSSSSANPTQAISIKRVMPWLVSTDGTQRVAFLDPSVDTSDGDFSAVYEPVGGPPILATQYLSTERGTVNGRLVNGVVSLSARTMKDSLRAMRASGAPVWLAWSDECLLVNIYGISITRLSLADGSTEYAVGFSFVGVG